MFLYGTYSQTHSQTKKAAGSPPLLRRGRPCREMAWLAQSPHNHYLVTLGVKKMGGTRQPCMLFPRVGSSRPLVDSAPCPQHGMRSALFTVVLPRGQPETAWLARVSW